MKRRFERFAALATALTLLALTFPANVFANSHSGSGGGGGGVKGPPGKTALQVYSPNQDVIVILKVPQVSSFGCGPTSITQLQAEDIHNRNIIPITPLAPSIQYSGYFKLNSGRTVAINYPGFSCIQGFVMTFVGLAQCPCNNNLPGYNPTCTDATHPFGGDPSITFPNGVNLAEATLNVPSPYLETVDISCNQGANSTIMFTLNPGGGNNWDNGDGGNKNVTNFQNSWVDIKKKKDDNCNRTGVFAYNLSDCTGFPGGVSCTTDSAGFCSTSTRVCNIQRKGSGGTALVTYLGPLSPP